MNNEELRMNNEELVNGNNAELSFKRYILTVRGNPRTITVDDTLAVSSSQLTTISNNKNQNNPILVSFENLKFNLFKNLKLEIGNYIHSHTPHALAQVSSPTEIQGLHVVSATNESNKYIGNAIYWQGEGSFTLTRDGTTLANTTTNSYLDLTAQEDTDYTYSANNITGEKETALPGGTPQITQVSITEISVTTESANIEISWLTDDVPSTSIVKYGTVKGSYSQTIEQETYNEDHSVIVSGLDPNQTYYFQVQSTSTDNNTSTGEEVSYTVPEAQKAKSIFVIIYEALENAFGTFVAWLYR